MINWNPEKRKLGSLKLVKKNANVMTMRDFENLKESITKFNYVAPMIVDQDGTVIGGNHRLRALRELGWEKDTEVFVICPSRRLTDEEREEYLLRDNQSGELDRDLLLENFDRKRLLTWGFEEGKDFKAQTHRNFSEKELREKYTESGTVKYYEFEIPKEEVEFFEGELQKVKLEHGSEIRKVELGLKILKITHERTEGVKVGLDL